MQDTTSVWAQRTQRAVKAIAAHPVSFDFASAAAAPTALQLAQAWQALKTSASRDAAVKKAGQRTAAVTAATASAPTAEQTNQTDDADDEEVRSMLLFTHALFVTLQGQACMQKRNAVWYPSFDKLHCKACVLDKFNSLRQSVGLGCEHTVKHLCSMSIFAVQDEEIAEEAIPE